MTHDPKGDLYCKPTREDAKAAAWDAYVARMEEGLEVVK
jgi:hypothetical protein